MVWARCFASTLFICYIFFCLFEFIQHFAEYSSCFGNWYICAWMKPTWFYSTFSIWNPICMLSLSPSNLSFCANETFINTCKHSKSKLFQMTIRFQHKSRKNFVSPNIWHFLAIHRVNKNSQQEQDIPTHSQQSTVFYTKASASAHVCACFFCDCGSTFAWRTMRMWTKYHHNNKL